VGVIAGASLTNDFHTLTIPVLGNSPHLTFSSTSRGHISGMPREWPPHVRSRRPWPAFQLRAWLRER
jgi:hypothetical protein